MDDDKPRSQDTTTLGVGLAYKSLLPPARTGLNKLICRRIYKYNGLQFRVIG